MKFAEVTRSLWSNPFEKSAGVEHERSRARQRQIISATLVGIAARVASILTVIVTTPLAFEYLGEDRFGLWATITSIVAFLSFADLGIGNGLMSSIATAKGAKDQEKIRSLVSSGYAMLTCVATAMLLVLSSIYPFIDWAELFNVRTDLAASEAGPATATFLVIFLVNIPVMMIQRIQLGLQDAHIYSAWQVASGVFSIIGTYLAVYFECGLPVLVLALSGPPLLVNVLNTFGSFTCKYRDIRPSKNYVSVSLSKKMLALGWVFLILQSAGMFNNLIDKFIIAQIIGSSAVASYSVVERLFNLLITVIAIGLIPLWPAFTEALENRDFDWIDKAFKITVIICMGFSVPAAVALVFAAPYILQVWIPSSEKPEMLLLSAFAIWKIVESMTSIVITYMNGLKIFRFQLVTMLASVALITPMKVVVIEEIGVAGAPLSMAFGMTVCIIVPFFVFRRKLTRSGVNSGRRKSANIEPAG